MSTKTPLGIFWDIENCQIPRTKAVSSVVKHIREFMANKHQECGFVKDFTCACDVIRMGATITESLNRNGVNVVHVNARAKNAAEDKLQELIDVFVDNYGIGSVLCIISSDINLAKQIRNARRKDLDVVLIHGINCSSDLKNLANECFLYEEVIKGAENYVKEDHQKIGILEVTNLPMHKRFEDMKVILTQLTENCGGKPGFIDNGKTLIRFASRDDAQRSLNRINGEDIFGSKIDVKLISEDTASHQMKNRSHSQQRLQETAGHHSHENQLRPGILEISNLPMSQRFDYIKSRLTQLTVNFGGIPQHIQNGKTLIRFGSRDEARRCLKQINGENVFGNKINVRMFGNDPAYTQSNNRGRSRQYLPKSGESNRNRSMSRTNLTQNDQPFGGSSSEYCKSVLKGLFTRKSDDIKELVVNLVSGWNDPLIKPNFVNYVERSRKYGVGDGKHTLFIKAVDAQACRALVNGAQKYLKPSDGLEWKLFVTDPSLYKNIFIDNKSVIEGLYSGKDQNVTELVKRLVMEWNDNELSPSFMDCPIAKVERDRQFSNSDGKVKLFVTATDPTTSKALVVSAKKNLTAESGIRWSHIMSNRLRDISGAVGSPAQNSNFSGKAKKPFPRTNDTSITSVIRRLDTKCDENVTQTVRRVIHNWNDPQIKANFVKLVERDRKFFDKDGDVLLFVIASSHEASLALVNAAAKYWQSRDGPKWGHYHPKSRSRKDTDRESNVGDFDHISSQCSSTQDLRVSSSLQNLSAIPVSDDHKSVIMGLKTESGQNLAKIVRKMVDNWRDRSVQPNFITAVDRFPGFTNADGNTPLLVTATSAQTCVALITGAEKHLNTGDGIHWTHFSSGEKLVKYYTKVRPEEEKSKTIKSEELDSFDSIRRESIGLTSQIKPSFSHKLSVPTPLPRKSITSEIKKSVITSDSKEKNFVKSVVSGFENLFKSSKSSSKTTATESCDSDTKLSPDMNLFNSPAVPFTHFIGDRVKDGLMIVIGGRLNTDAESFAIDFFANTDIAFNFDVRVRHSRVSRNSRVNYDWGNAEVAGTFPFVVGHVFDIIIQMESNQFVVKINGKRFCDFKHRIALESVKGLSITGDLSIHWLRFTNNW